AVSVAGTARTCSIASCNGTGVSTWIASVTTAATQSAITTAGSPKDFVHSLAALILFICRFIVVLLSFSASRNKEGNPSAPPRSDGHPLRGDEVRWDANGQGYRGGAGRGLRKRGPGWGP